MIRAATVRMTTCRKVKPNRMASFFSTSAGGRARIGASLSRRAIGDHSSETTRRGRRGGDGGTGGDEVERAGRPDRDGGDAGDRAGDGAGTAWPVAVPRGDGRDGGGDDATARRAGTVPRGDGGDGGSTRWGRAGTAGPGPPGTVPARVPVAERPGAENTGVTGAGGRFGAVCGRGAAENVAAGTGPVAGRLGVAGVGALLNAAGAGRPAGAGEAAGAGWWENRAGATPRPAAV